MTYLRQKWKKHCLHFVFHSIVRTIILLSWYRFENVSSLVCYTLTSVNTRACSTGVLMWRIYHISPTSLESKEGNIIRFAGNILSHYLHNWLIMIILSITLYSHSTLFTQHFITLYTCNTLFTQHFGHATFYSRNPLVTQRFTHATLYPRDTLLT